jgi:copper transport protein
VLAKAPADVRVVFDDVVKVAGGNEAIRNGGGSVLAGKPRIVGGRTLVLPLRSGLRNADYSVRWSVLADDGHVEQGVLAFGVGAGRAPPTQRLTASSSVDAASVSSRTLWLLGILLASGAAIFALVTRTPVEGRHLFTGFLLAFLGASSLGHEASGTRFGLITDICAIIALVGGALAALAPVERRLRIPAMVAALALLPLPTLAGHALDPGRPRVLAAAVDLAHLTGVAAWFGGLAVLATWRRVPAGVMQRYAKLALVSIAVLGIAGIGRALIELTAVRQLWATGYGQAILVKTAIFAVLLGIGWLNRARLLDVFSRLRRTIAVELVLLVAVIVAAAVLTELKPGRQSARAAATSRVSAPQRAALPPPGTLTLAKQAGDVVVALTTGAAPQVTLLGQDGNAFPVASVRVDGTKAAPCGAGCWRPASVPDAVVLVQADGLPSVTFVRPARPRPAETLARAAAAAFRTAGSVSIAESLASGTEEPERSVQRVEAPDRFSYQIAGGPQGIVIGTRRWDRPGPSAPWTRDVQQPPLAVPSPVWSPRSRNAFVVREDRLTQTVALLDPTLSAWFEIRVDRRTHRPLVLHMTAPAHFMTDRYSAYGTPRRIFPPR